MSQPTDRPSVPRYWVLGELKRDNAIGGYPEGWHNVVTACDYDALDAEQQRVEEQLATDRWAAVEKTKLADATFNRVQGERDQAQANLAAIRQCLQNIEGCAHGIMPIYSDMHRLLQTIIELKDARWTRLYAILAEAKAGLSQSHPGTALLQERDEALAKLAQAEQQLAMTLPSVVYTDKILQLEQRVAGLEQERDAFRSAMNDSVRRA